MKRDLIGQPGAVPLDGSAHVLDNRGFIFLFNESERTRAASVPLNDLIGLTAGPAFDIAQLYPARTAVCRAARYGATVHLPVEGGGAAVFEIAPAAAASAKLPSVVWHNLGDADVHLAGGQLEIAGLQGWEGQRRELMLLLTGAFPKRLTVNGQAVPFRRRGELLVAQVQFGAPAVPQVLEPCGHLAKIRARP